MREIIFRGRHKSGDWLYGDLLMQYEPHDPQIYAKQPGYGGYFDVDRETVGQFTGLLDLNGQKVFEGDIVRWSAGRNVAVIWDGACARFTGAANDAGHSYCIYRNVEVIGNIHDNPEMLGE